jgi:hypothetical protein
MSLEYEFDLPVYSKRNYIPFISDTLVVLLNSTIAEWSDWFHTATLNLTTVTWT